jgi:signal transduction histidine kinase
LVLTVISLPFLLDYWNLHFGIAIGTAISFSVFAGILLDRWEQEAKNKLKLRDQEANKYFQLESLQEQLSSSTTQIEKQAIVSERSRISREIHDHAAHELVAAYISFQTIRTLLDTENQDNLEFYDDALERLNKGVNQVRETIHNLQPITKLGVENLEDICNRFPGCPVEFVATGDTTKVPAYIWNILESCLKECLTNIARHSKATFVFVELDTTKHFIRFSIENNGTAVTKEKSTGSGTGLRNLRYRVNSAGGNLAIDIDGESTKNRGAPTASCYRKVFKVVCVIPLSEEHI